MWLVISQHRRWTSHLPSLHFSPLGVPDLKILELCRVTLLQSPIHGFPDQGCRSNASLPPLMVLWFGNRGSLTKQRELFKNGYVKTQPARTRGFLTDSLRCCQACFVQHSELSET